VAKFVYDGQDVIEDLADDGYVLNSYLNGPGIDNKIRRTDGENGDLYYLTDHLGSTIALTDVFGTLLEAPKTLPPTQCEFCEERYVKKPALRYPRV